MKGLYRLHCFRSGTDGHSYPGDRFNRWLCYASVLMLCIGIPRLTSECHRLLLDSSPNGAIDLKLLYNWTQMWFASKQVYGPSVRATYPPASYTIYWPLMGWLDLPFARWFWALTTVVALIWLIRLLLHASHAQTKNERLFIALLILAPYSTAVTIGNGQLILHILPILITSLLLATHRPSTWWKSGLGIWLFVFCLIKPSVTAPFFWLLLFLPGSIWPAFCTILVYGMLTLFSAAFQQDNILTLMLGWVEASGTWVKSGALGYANLGYWMKQINMPELALPAGLLTLLLLGGWIYLQRNRVDFWILFGVTALVARLWTYHNLYDDGLTLVPMMVAFRHVRNSLGKSNLDIVVVWILAFASLASLVPARVHADLTWPGFVFRSCQTLNLLLLLGFLLRLAHQGASVSKQPTPDPLRDLKGGCSV
jgi:hypothetical protein